VSLGLVLVWGCPLGESEVSKLMVGHALQLGSEQVSAVVERVGTLVLGCFGMGSSQLRHIASMLTV
jgi:hypothetical protein